MIPRSEHEIAEISTALFRRQDAARLFVLLTTYGDESGTGGSAWTLVAAALGGKKHWTAFERGYAVLRQQYGFSVFHAKELMDTDGEFKGWSIVKKHNLVTDLTDLLDQNLIGCYIAAINDEDYRSHYLGNERVSGKWDSKYGICFRVVVSALLEETRIRSHRKKNNRLELVFERGARNAPNAVEIFNWMKEKSPPEYDGLLGVLAFDGKSECPSLAVADFLAYTFNMYINDRSRSSEERRPTSESKELRSKIYLIEAGQEQLAALRNQALLSHKARMKMVSPVLLVERGA
jgi:hypothetical protein